MYDIISIGNISIDLFFKGKSLTYDLNRFQLAVGGKYFVDYFHSSVGGGGANVALGCAKHGLKSAVYSIIGANSFKKIIFEELELRNVSTKLCRFEEKYFNVSCVLLSAKGERSIIHYSTPHEHLFKERSIIDKLSETKNLYLGNLPNVPLNERIALLSAIKSKNVNVYVNLGVTDCRRPKSQILELLKNIDILILNGHEFSELVKAPYKDIHFKENVVDWYIKQLKDKLVLITEGEKGSYAYLNGKVYHEPAQKLKEIVDTTGAGDAYSAGFISDYSKDKNVSRAMSKATNYAQRILTKVGAN